MRILHVISTLNPAAGGPPGVASRLAAAQAALGHSVTIVSTVVPGQEGTITASLQTIPHIDSVRLEFLPPEPDRPFQRQQQRQLDQLIGSVDVVHMHGVWEGFLRRAAASAAAQRVPYAIAPHGMLYPWSLNQKRLKKRLALALVYRRMINGAAFIHALNSDEQKAMEPLGLWPPIRIAPNGVFTDEFDQLPAPGTFYQAHPELRGRPYALFLSRLHPGKGLHHLAEAFALMASSVPDLQLVIAGPDAGARSDFEARIARAGLTDRVHVVGPMYGHQKLAAFRDACCFCLPSEHETFSMAIVEAMGCGVPAIISDACHFPEVAEARAGRVVPLVPHAIAQALQDVASDPALRQRMGEAGRAFVAQRYNWPDIARRCIELYRDAVGDGWTVAEPEAGRLRVLHVIDTLDPDAGGPPAVATRLAAAEASLGHDVRVITYTAPVPERVRLTIGSVPGIKKVRIESIPAMGTRERLFARRALGRLRAAMKQADVVHLHSVWDSIIRVAAGEAARQNKPYFVLANGMLDPWSLSQQWLKKEIALLVYYRRMIRGASAIHALNADEKRLMAPLVQDTPVVTIPNGVFPEELFPLPAPGTFRARHPELGNHPYVLFLSRLHYKKGLDYLADAFAVLAKAMPDVRLVVAGPDGGAREPFLRQIERHGLTGRVVLPGPLYGPEKFAALVDAACFCLPSRQEGFSVAITEALACGVPVVITKACHFPEVEEAGAGRVVEADARSIADALTEVLVDPARREQMGRAGAALVAARFTWHRIAQQAVAAYHDAISGQPKPPAPAGNSYGPPRLPSVPRPRVNH